jgi:MFS family permease
MNALPALIVPPQHVGRIVSLAVGINQVAFVPGPALLGALRDWTGDYRAPFRLCLVLELVAAAVVLLGRHGARRSWNAAARD